jgi:TetR/AcrR family transcriptional regulator, tetracycline repressor protein
MIGSSHLGKRVVEIVESADRTTSEAAAGRDALLHFAIGYTLEEQTHATMAEHGAAPARLDDPDEAYVAALAVIVRGITARPS